VSRPDAKGWCPGALRPMQSGDGLIVRVRPVLARLSAAQVDGLCMLSQTFGNGTIDLTSRANLQLRGFDETGLEAVQDALATLDLLDADAETETRRNIISAPFWQPNDQTEALSRGLIDRLGDLPDLPGKFGFAIDTGPARVLGGVSADIRMERDRDQNLIVRADGAGGGRLVDAGTAIDAVIEMARWFETTRDASTRRMAAAVARGELPADWQRQPPCDPAPTLEPGQIGDDAVYGVPFGRINAADLRALMQASGGDTLTVTPWRMFALPGTQLRALPGFVTTPDAALMQVDACPGMPNCASASVETRQLAQALAPRYGAAGLHVSGCAKGCARPRAAHHTLVGRDGLFDLVEAGCSWDEPERRGLSPAALLSGTETL